MPKYCTSLNQDPHAQVRVYLEFHSRFRWALGPEPHSRPSNKLSPPQRGPIILRLVPLRSLFVLFCRGRPNGTSRDPCRTPADAVLAEPNPFLDVRPWQARREGAHQEVGMCLCCCAKPLWKMTLPISSRPRQQVSRARSRSSLPSLPPMARHDLGSAVSLAGSPAMSRGH